MGKSVASAEELQNVMKTWMSLTMSGPRKNPGLDIWTGYDSVKAFANEEAGQDRIIDCLNKETNRFRKFGMNQNNQETWECSNMEFLGKPSSETQLQSGYPYWLYCPSFVF